MSSAVELRKIYSTDNEKISIITEFKDKKTIEELRSLIEPSPSLFSK